MNSLPTPSDNSKPASAPDTSAPTVRVRRLLQPLDDAICYMVLRGEWPLISTHDGGEYLVCFTRHSHPERLFPWFQRCFCGCDTLSLLAIRHPAELWAALNSKGGSESELPYGLIVDLSCDEERTFSQESISGLLSFPVNERVQAIGQTHHYFA